MATSYVIVWENNTFGHAKVSGHSWSGHSSINIGDFFDKQGPESPVSNSYASWWPTEGQGFSFGELAKSFVSTNKQKGSLNLSICEDVQVEGYLPDHVIKLNTTAEQEMKMRAEWLAVLLKKGGASYKTFRKNCSTIAARVLHAGGFIRHKWAVDLNFVWTPADIAKAAQDAGGQKMRWKDFLRVLETSFITSDDFLSQKGTLVTQARSGRYCSTGVSCVFQPHG